MSVKPGPERSLLIAVVLAFTATTGASAADLYKRGSWASLASDQRAERVGDSLTVVIYESAQASHSAQNSASRSGRLSGELSSGVSTRNAAQASLEGSYSGTGETDRSGQMVAQISVVVDEVLPNGDLHVSGEQALNINGDRTRIRLKGRVRPVDIASNNTVLSSSLADVTIDYGGAGFTTRSAAPGVVQRVLSWFGLR